MFDPVFGKPRDAAYAALNNGPNLVCNSTAAQMQSIAWFIQYGPLTGEPLDSNYFRGDHLVGKLSEKGVTNGITAVLAGGHHWSTADEHMRQTLPLHWNVLGPSSIIPPVVLQSVVSRKTHGAAGNFDLALPGVEPRGGALQLVFTFAQPLARVGSASASVGTISQQAIGADAHQYVVSLANVPNARTVNVTLSNVADTIGNESPTVAASVSVLLGDTSRDGQVNGGDALQTRNHSGESAGAGNFAFDVNLDGTVNGADTLLVRNHSGDSVTP